MVCKGVDEEADGDVAARLVGVVEELGVESRVASLHAPVNGVTHAPLDTSWSGVVALGKVCVECGDLGARVVRNDSDGVGEILEAVEIGTNPEVAQGRFDLLGGYHYFIPPW